MSRSSSPAPEKKPRWYKLIWQAFTFTRDRYRPILWQLPAVFFGVLVLGYVIGLLVNHPVYVVIIAIPIGALAAMYTLTNRFTKVQYKDLDGEVGASQAVLGTIKRGWTFTEQPVAFDAKSQDIVFRGVGRPGVILVGEAKSPKVKRLLSDEKKRLNRVAKDVPVTTIEVGDREGQVPLAKLTTAVRKLKPKLTKAEVGEVEKRLSALGAAKLPIPKGVDPMRARMNHRNAR